MKIEKRFYTEFNDYVKECMDAVDLEHKNMSPEELEHEKAEMESSFNEAIEKFEQRRMAMHCTPSKKLYRQFVERVVDASLVAEWIPADMEAEEKERINGKIQLEMPWLVVDENWPDGIRKMLLDLLTSANEVFIIPREELIRIVLTYNLYDAITPEGAQ